MKQFLLRHAELDVQLHVQHVVDLLLQLILPDDLHVLLKYLLLLDVPHVFLKQLPHRDGVRLVREVDLANMDRRLRDLVQVQHLPPENELLLVEIFELVYLLRQLVHDLLFFEFPLRVRVLLVLQLLPHKLFDLLVQVHEFKGLRVLLVHHLNDKLVLPHLSLNLADNGVLDLLALLLSLLENLLIRQDVRHVVVGEVLLFGLLDFLAGLLHGFRGQNVRELLAVA